MTNQLSVEDEKQLRKKTSVSIDDDLWKKFCSINVLEYGNRMNSDVLEELIRNHIKKKEREKNEST